MRVIFLFILVLLSNTHLTAIEMKKQIVKTTIGNIAVFSKKVDNTCKLPKN
jgi:hypothetical protein